MAVKPIPDGYNSVTPYLIVDDAAKAIEFYTEAFGATELFRMNGPDGRVGHAEIQIGDSRVMMSDENPMWQTKSPKSLGVVAPVHLMIYVDDCDTVFNRALDEGGTQVQPLTNQFYGDRSGTLDDPFGFRWTVSTHVEDVPAEEMEARAKESMKKMQAEA